MWWIIYLFIYYNNAHFNDIFHFVSARNSSARKQISCVKIKGTIIIYVKFSGARKVKILKCFRTLYIQILSGLKNWNIQDLTLNFLHRYSLTIWLQSSFIKEKFFVAAFNLYGCDFLLLLWKGAQNECALLKYFYSFLTAELNNIESEDEVLLRNFYVKRVLFEIAMMNIFNNCIAGSLSNNYFPLNESPSLY